MAQLRVTVFKDDLKYQSDVRKFMRINGMKDKQEHLAKKMVSQIDSTQTMNMIGLSNKVANAKTFDGIAHDIARGRRYKYEYLK